MKLSNIDLDNQASELARTIERLTKEIDELVKQRCDLVAGLSQLQDNRLSMEEAQKSSETRIDNLKK